MIVDWLKIGGPGHGSFEKLINGQPKEAMKFRKSRLIIDLMTRIRVVVEENMENDMSCQIGHGLYKFTCQN